MASHIENPIQLLTPSSLIIYRQQINPSNGMRDKLCFQLSISRYRQEIIKIQVGILCLNKLSPDS